MSGIGNFEFSEGVGSFIYFPTSAGYISFGTPPAQSGAVRLANNLAIKWRRVTDAADINGITVDNTDNMSVGDHTNLVGVKVKAASTASLTVASDAARIDVSATSIIGFLSSVQRFSFTTTEFTPSVSLVEGFFVQAMADAPQTISATNSLNNTIQTTGANTAVRALTINIAPTAGLRKYIKNSCTGSGITVQFSSGTATATIAAGACGYVVASGGNALWLGT